MERNTTIQYSDVKSPKGPKEPTAHELFNEAAEWLSYSRGTCQALADLVHEADGVDCKSFALALEAVAAMTRVGAECAARGHALVEWERGKSVTAAVAKAAQAT